MKVFITADDIRHGDVLADVEQLGLVAVSVEPLPGDRVRIRCLQRVDDPFGTIRDGNINKTVRRWEYEVERGEEFAVWRP